MKHVNKKKARIKNAHQFATKNSTYWKTINFIVLAIRLDFFQYVFCVGYLRARDHDGLLESRIVRDMQYIL